MRRRNDDDDRRTDRDASAGWRAEYRHQHVRDDHATHTATRKDDTTPSGDARGVATTTTTTETDPNADVREGGAA